MPAPLATALYARLPAQIARDLPLDQLEQALRGLVARASAAHPAVAPDAAAFVAHLAATAGTQWPRLSQLVAEVAAEDLYLACACARGDAAAVAYARRR